MESDFLKLAFLHCAEFPRDLPQLLYIAIVHAFLLLVVILPKYGYTTVYSPIEGHLGCFQFLPSQNKTAMNI